MCGMGDTTDTDTDTYALDILIEMAEKAQRQEALKRKAQHEACVDDGDDPFRPEPVSKIAVNKMHRQLRRSARLRAKRQPSIVRVVERPTIAQLQKDIELLTEELALYREIIGLARNMPKTMSANQYANFRETLIDAIDRVEARS